MEENVTNSVYIRFSGDLSTFYTRLTPDTTVNLRDVCTI